MTQLPTEGRGANIVRLVSLIIFGLLVTASILVYFGMTRFLQERTASRFEYDTQTTTAAVSNRLMQYADLLYNGRSLLTLKPDTTNEQWQRFFDGQGGLVRHAGVGSVAYALYGTGVTEAAHVAALNAQARVTPPITLKPGGARDAYAGAVLIASTSQLTYLLGTDMLSDPVRKTTLETSSITRVPQASPPLALKGGPQGFLLVLPHYSQDEKLLGFVVLSFRSRELMEELLNEKTAGTTTKVTDITDKSKPLELYTSPHWLADGLKRADQVSVGGRIWEITYSISRDQYQDTFIRAVPLMMLVLGLVCSFVVLAAILITFRARTSMFGRFW